MEKRKTEKKVDVDDDDISIDEEEPNIILMGNEDALNGDNGIDPTDDDDVGLGVIFPDADDDEDSERKETVVEADDDLTKALEQLDSEEDEDLTAEDFGFDDGEIPTL
jgi:DNA-directed RNA polymerase specialized sigma24 family protein